MTRIGWRRDGDRPRWRDRPRARLWSWDTPGAQVVGYPVLVGCAYRLAGESFVQVVTRDGIAPRLRAAGIGLTALAVALAMTWIAVLHLRRPVEHEPPKPEEVSLPPAVSREAVEAAAQRFRPGPSL